MTELEEELRVVRIYNKATGANLTHWDLRGVGFLEESKLILALQEVI